MLTRTTSYFKIALTVNPFSLNRAITPTSPARCPEPTANKVDALGIKTIIFSIQARLRLSNNKTFPYVDSDLGSVAI